MEVLFFIFNLLIASPTEVSQSKISREETSSAKVVNVGNTIVDDLNGLIR